jgi:hypothetical protein
MGKKLKKKTHKRMDTEKEDEKKEDEIKDEEENVDEIEKEDESENESTSDEIISLVVDGKTVKAQQISPEKLKSGKEVLVAFPAIFAYYTKPENKAFPETSFVRVENDGGRELNLSKVPHVFLEVIPEE